MTSSHGSIFLVTGPFMRGNHRSPVDSPHKGQWCGALMLSFICAWTSGWAIERRKWFDTPLQSLWRHYNVYFPFRVTSFADGGVNKNHPNQRDLEYNYVVIIGSTLPAQGRSSLGARLSARAETMTLGCRIYMVPTVKLIGSEWRIYASVT